MIISGTGKDILSNPANYSTTDDLSEVSELVAIDKIPAQQQNARLVL